jgi:ribose transport system ATP-binding protein
MTSLVTLTDITKTFSTNTVLDKVSLDIQPGEIHGLLGHNGSGKSTLIKILAGVYAPDAGEIAVNGRVLSFPLHPDDSRRNGFAFVHQGLGLADDLTVLENLAVTNYLTGFAGQISWRQHAAAANKLLARFGVDIDLDTAVGELEPVKQAIVAIARALGSIETTGEARLLVLDEPTVYLPRDRIQTLFDTVRRLAAEGDGILFVSHRLDEVLNLTDRISVLSGGRLVASTNSVDLNERQLVRMIIGRDLDSSHSTEASHAQSGAAVRVRTLRTRALHGVDFNVESGEVLGVTGLAGSGFADIPYALFGARQASAGTLELGDGRLHLPALTESAAIANRIALVPEDRPRLAIVREASICENISLLALPQFVKGGALRPRSENSYASKLVKSFNILLADLSAPIEELSGGNQQKCVLAKWLSGEPRLLLLHEPTQGVDVGGRFEIWQHLRRAAQEGAAAIVASESAEELAELCDRVLIFRDGQITAELVGADVEKHRIVELALGGAQHPGMS